MKNRDQIRLKVYGKPERVNLFVQKLDAVFLEVSKGKLKKDPEFKDVKMYIELNQSRTRQHITKPKRVSKMRELLNRLVEGGSR